jgi:autotransporter-associated beta strand protein
MNATRICKHLRVALKHSALAVAMGAWLVAGTALAAPANDAFANAIDLTGAGSGQTGDAIAGTQTGTDNLDATLEVGEPATVTYPDSTTSSFSNTVWFKWTCPAAGNLTVNTFGSTASPSGEWDAVLGIYTGASVSALTPLGATPKDTGDKETMTVAVTAGTTYFIQLAGYDNAVAANILLNWSFVGPSAACDLLTFGPGAVITGTDIAWTLPAGTDLATLAPTFTLSADASCNQTSGVIPTPDFSSGPVHYIVTAQDTTTTQDYTVTVTVTQPSLPPVRDGLIVCLAADSVNPTDTNQVRIVGGDAFVKQWNDGSGLGHNATQTTAGDQPKYIGDGLNGKPVVRFTGANDDAGSQMMLGDLSASFPAAGSMFAVSTINTDGRYNLFDNRNNDSRWVANSWSESQPGVFRSGRTGMTYASWPQTGSHVFAMESSSSLYRFVIDGTQIGSAGGNYHSGSGSNWTLGDRPGNGQQLNGDIPELILYNRVLTTEEADMVGAYLTVKYGLVNIYPALPAPAVPTDLVATPVSSGIIRLSWPPAYAATSYNVWVRNTATSAVQVLSTAALSCTVTGLTDGVPYEFKVAATNFTATSDYSAVVGAIPAVGTACDMLTFVFPDQPDAIISYPNISVTVPVGTDLTALAPTYTVSPNASGSPPSGTSRNFTGPQIYTVTAENGVATKTYTVTVTQGAVPSIFTWATAATGNWSDSSKWTNDLASGSKPIDPGQSNYVLNFTQAGAYVATQNLSDGFLLNQLNFGGAVTIDGTHGLALTTHDTTLPPINQNSAGAVTVGTPLSLAADGIVGGSGSGQVTLTGLVSGVGGLTKDISGVLQLYGLIPNTYEGGTVINGGTLHMGAYIDGISPACVNPAGTGPVTLNNGATIRFDRVTVANALIVNGGTLYSQNGWGVTWTGPITLNANLTLNAGYGLTSSGDISGTGGLIKTGGNTLVLSGSNSYSGPTTVTSGTLECKNMNALGSGDLSISSGAKVNLNYTGDRVVTSLTLAGAVMPPGTYDSSDPSGLITGTGTVTVGGGSDYDTWLGEFTFAAGADTTPTGDPDGDGLINQQEYAFGLNPTLGSSVNPITRQLDKSTGVFKYTRRKDSGLTYIYQSSTTLKDPWDEFTPVSAVSNDAAPVEEITVTVPSSLRANPKLFLRVKAQ